MPLQHHPKIGSILICDFNKGFVAPEMVKRRPVIVISPPINVRHRLCTIIPISTEPPKIVMRYHVDLGDLTRIIHQELADVVYPFEISYDFAVESQNPRIRRPHPP
ncbi:MAG: type II toxin-antitoxin system PemK/MazF family toxin [Roseomonas sp.]|nr:type II toxin-antitoxin system PemK/MazF family toxin [Roseomonas sp.]